MEAAPPPVQAMRANAGKPPLSLVDAHALRQLADVMAFGARKYARDDWRKGRPYSDLVDCLLRHATAFNAGEDNDPETGLPHMAHVMANAMFLIDHARRLPHLDDRWKPPAVE